MVMRREDRKGRARRQSFKPQLGDNRLEPRVVLSSSSSSVSNPYLIAIRAQQLNQPVPILHQPKALTRRGGQSVRILTGRGSAFDVTVRGFGTVTARPTNDGRWNLNVFGTDANSELTINPTDPSLLRQFGKETAHTFNPQYGVGNPILEVAAINVTTGKIGQILGFRTANLSGPIVLRNDSPIDRIAFNRLLPGALIQTAGDLDTLDVFVDANLSGANTGIKVGRDLNWTNIRGNLNIDNGATLSTARDIGLVPQGDKGTAVGGQGLLVQGNLTIGATGSVAVGRNLSGPSNGNSLTVFGNFSGASRLSVGGLVTRPIVILGTTTA
jgi:hypothetical protein